VVFTDKVLAQDLCILLEVMPLAPPQAGIFKEGALVGVILVFRIW